MRYSQKEAHILRFLFFSTMYGNATDLLSRFITHSTWNWVDHIITSLTFGHRLIEDGDNGFNNLCYHY